MFKGEETEAGKSSAYIPEVEQVSTAGCQPALVPTLSAELATLEDSGLAELFILGL